MSRITIKIYRTSTVITVINYRHPFVRQDPSLFEKGPGEYKIPFPVQISGQNSHFWL